MSGSLSGVVSKFYTEYTVNTPKKLKVIDAYLTYVFFTGVIQVTILYNNFLFFVSLFFCVSPSLFAFLLFVLKYLISNLTPF